MCFENPNSVNRYKLRIWFPPCLYSLCVPLLIVLIILLFIFKITSKYKCLFLSPPFLTHWVVIAETSNAHQHSSLLSLGKTLSVYICMRN